MMKEIELILKDVTEFRCKCRSEEDAKIFGEIKTSGEISKISVFQGLAKQEFFLRDVYFENENKETIYLKIETFVTSGLIYLSLTTDETWKEYSTYIISAAFVQSKENGCCYRTSLK